MCGVSAALAVRAGRLASVSLAASTAAAAAAGTSTATCVMGEGGCAWTVEGKGGSFSPPGAPGFSVQEGPGHISCNMRTLASRPSSPSFCAL